MALNKENFAINCLKSKYIGDDCAVLKQNCEIWCKDLFVENTHFKKTWLSAYDIGKKAVLVNFSDILAMNALPKFALIGLGYPKNTDYDFIKNLCLGIKETCEKFNCEIIGGDTIKSDLIFVSVSVGGIKQGKILYRNGAKLGDFIGFTGILGNSLKSFMSLRNGGKIGKNSKFKNIILRQNFIKKGAKFLNSAMDISDGLNSDLLKFCDKKSIKFVKKLSNFEKKSGEEYEILFSCSPKNLQALRKISQKCRTKITIFGRLKRGKLKTNAKNEHF